MARRVLTVILTSAACALLFLVPSSYLVVRGQPLGLAAIAGGLTFPLVPVAWHLLAERRRKKREIKGALTRADRFVLRLIAMALVAIAPLVVLDRGRVWAGLTEYPLWFVPGMGPVPLTEKLLARVPAEAEVVAVFRDDPRVLFDAPSRPEGEALVAVGARKVLVAFAAHDPIEIPVKQLMQGTPLALDTFVDGGVAGLVSPDWKQKGGGPRAMLATELERAPDDATVAVGYAPAIPDPDVGAVAAAGWISLDALLIHAQARVTLVDAATATSFETEVRTELTKAAASAPAICRDTVTRIVEAMRFERVETVVTIRADLPRSVVTDLALCKTAL